MSLDVLFSGRLEIIILSQLQYVLDNYMYHTVNDPKGAKNTAHCTFCLSS